ncbi:uncharacterized protein N7484_000849 [Penicillium longicatenatum]|uniref:uncharacterized protein n=1 Tax=Penicillium longicatenatum TaxID=1561947 RepID=UPI0025477923|nr:uncharacterized protein N7484_000849 [Penicillium longicatenatum]KAJ5657200.1 hypothetical protein N7484_000849 [Penicillium longicatenatum]
MLRSWLSSGSVRALCRAPRSLRPFLIPRKNFSSVSNLQTDRVPLRKQLKQEAKSLKAQKKQRKQNEAASRQEWELTVGVEIHAQLDTAAKLFSRAATSTSATPNSNVALFDLAFPGSQPKFQAATLLPALRAAIALNCQIQPVSRFDRKHYFYQDQPSGYQITQYYEPFARNGYIDLFDYDGIAPEDGDRVRIDIQQVQLEQDTAKSQEYPGPTSTQLLDFNRVSHPLIEIITLPQIHSPATAAACVRKLQSILQACGAVTTGMELGGLRADINVSIRRRSEALGGLGQRTEIKNLSSFKAVEDAIIAEKNRQIAVLESGGKVLGETRGWTIGSTETHLLRDKEGAVDYRYMPDPDIPPLVIGEDLITCLQESLPSAPDTVLLQLIGPEYGLPIEDAKPLIELDDGARLEYYQDVVDILQKEGLDKHTRAVLARMAGNWVLHELGGLLTKADQTWHEDIVPAQSLADLIDHLQRGLVTGPTAKQVLASIFDGDRRPVPQLLEEDNLLLRPLSREEYISLAESAIALNPKMVEQIRGKQLGKLGWFVGQMMRMGEKGRVEAPKAEMILRELILGEKA